MHRIMVFHCLIAALAFSACAPTKLPPAEGLHRMAVVSLKRASSDSLGAEQRAALYLDAAREASSLLDSPHSGESARMIYNQAAADLTVLLRSANNGVLWNRPLTLTSGGTTYHLRFAKETRDGVWNPDHFTSYTPAATVDLKTIKRRNRVDGIGGALVGVRKTDPREAFSPLVEVAAPVTTTLDFNGGDVTLSLIDPTEQTKTRISNKDRALDADFSTRKSPVSSTRNAAPSLPNPHRSP